MRLSHVLVVDFQMGYIPALRMSYVLNSRVIGVPLSLEFVQLYLRPIAMA